MKRIWMLIICCTSIQAYVLLITPSYNRPDFIEIQDKTFKKFLEDDYELVVFNDAPDKHMCKQIQQICKKLDIQCIRVPQEIHDRPYLPRKPGEPYHRPNIRHANVVQYSLDTLGFNHNGIVGIIDSDMFLVRPLNLTQYMQNLDIASTFRGTGGGISYLWPGLCFFHMDRLPNKRMINFNCGQISEFNVDTGGYTYFYLKKYKNLKIKSLIEHFSCRLFCPDRFGHPPKEELNLSKKEQIERLKNLGFNEKEIKFLQKKPHSIEFVFENHFFHFRAGTNYDNQSAAFMQHKMDLINEYLEDILSD